MHGQLLRETDQQCLLPKTVMTSNSWEKLRGLLARKPLQTGEAMIIAACAAVHTIGMRYALDLIFLDKHWRILKIAVAVKPWRIAACPGAAMTVETLAGSLERWDLITGEQLIWKKQGS